jgi:tetratricopeptide (TPR) repeat protein
MHPITRWLLALAAVAGLAAAALSAVDLHRQREALRADVEAADLGDRWPHLADAVLRDVDPYWGRINLARALVYDAADSRRMEGMTVRQAALESVAAPRRLSLARELASEALAERPVVWQSWLFRGAALYRDWFRRLDERLFTERDQWEQDLDMAIRLAPGRAEPTRVRAGIIVDLWPAMSADERALELPTLAAAFENTATLKQFVVGWLTAAEEPFAAIPDEPDALAVVRDATRRLQDWSRYRQALDAWTTSRLSASTAFLDRAEWLADHGESRMVRRDLVQYIHQSPPGSTWAPAVSRALDIMPRGLANRRSTGAFSRWLGYGLESAVRGQPLVPPEALRGLAAGIEDLNDPERALAAVLSGRMDEADRIARRNEDLNTERWGLYCLARVRQHLEVAEIDAARALWRGAHRSVRDAPFAADVARTLDDPPDAVEALPETGVRTAFAWQWKGDEAMLDLPPLPGDSTVSVYWDTAPANGTVMEILVDFRSAWIGEVRASDAAEITVGRTGRPLHLRVRPLVPGRATPGLVEWRPVE